jgi:hypothetical protein
MGFELGDRHHETNLNVLANEFGLRFNSDIVAPKDWIDSRGKPYDAPIEFSNIDSAHHPMLQEVRNLRLRNVCTLTIDPGADVLIKLGDNRICWLKRDTVEYSNGILRSGNLQCELIDKAPWVPVLAEAPKGLTGSGKVMAIGTWHLLEEKNDETGNSNKMFIRNILNWLVNHI